MTETFGELKLQSLVYFTVRSLAIIQADIMSHVITELFFMKLINTNLVDIQITLKTHLQGTF